MSDEQQTSKTAPDLAAELETVRQQRAEDRAAQIAQVAQVAQRIGGVEEQAVAAAMRSTATATAAETDRERRAAVLAVEAYAAHRQADELQSQVRVLSADVSRLALTSARVETELAKLNEGIATVLAQTKVMRESYAIDETAPRERHRFPILLQWFEGMMTLSPEGITRLTVLDELIALHLARKRSSRTIRAVLIVLVPFLVAITAWLLSRYFPGVGPR
jgi:hypothetical protein